MKNTVFRKLSFLKGKIAALFAVFAIFSAKASAFHPAIAGLAVLPAVGMMGAKSSAAKAVIARANRDLFLLEVFLVTASAIILIGLLFLVVKLIRNRKKKA